MEKKGFLLLASLFVLFVAACATTSSTPSVTASGSPGDVRSAPAAAGGTLDDLYQFLIGEWRGDFTNGFRGTLIIKEINVPKKEARGIYTVRGTDIALIVIDGPQDIDFTPGPNPKLFLRQAVIPGGS